MSKRHFNDLAARLYRMKPVYDEKTSGMTDRCLMAQWEKMVREMADFCASHSTTFKRGQFLTACGV